jgi:GNAT superfamily N-acetyltransferase
MHGADVRPAAADTFAVREPTPGERRQAVAWLSPGGADYPGAVLRVAVTLPGGELLGAIGAAPRAVGPRTVGDFAVYVRPEFRRRKVGSALWAELQQAVAARGWAGLSAGRLVHQDEPAHPFCARLGLTPTHRFVTFVCTMRAVLAAADRPLARFRNHSHLRDV